MRAQWKLLSIGLISMSAVLIASLLHQPTATAQSAESTITLTPVTQRFDIATSQTKAAALTVTNSGKTDYDFIVYARPYSVADISYAPDYTSLLPRSDAYAWVQFQKTSFHLNVGQSVDVPYTIRVPETAAPGGHYGVIFAEMQPKGEEKNQSVIRKKRVGTILYATVQGKTIKTGEFVSSGASFWQTQPPLTADVRLHNSGNVDFTATTTMVVKDLFGRTKYSFEREASLFPETTREVSLQWDDVPWFGLFKVELHANYLDKKHDSSHFVLMMPRWLPGVILLVVVIGVAYAAIRRRR